MARIPFRHANRFFLFRIAWESHNLGRLCVVCGPLSVAGGTRTDSILFLVGSCSRIQHRTGVSQTMRGPFIVGEVCSLFFDLERFARGTRNLSGIRVRSISCDVFTVFPYKAAHSAFGASLTNSLPCGQSLLLRYSGLLRRVARTSGIANLFPSRRDHCTVCWSWFTCTLMSCCWLLREEVSTGSHIWWSRPHFSGPSLPRPLERRVFLVAPGLALLPRRSGISVFFSVSGPQSLKVSGVLTGLLFFRGLPSSGVTSH